MKGFRDHTRNITVYHRRKEGRLEIARFARDVKYWSNGHFVVTEWLICSVRYGTGDETNVKYIDLTNRPDRIRRIMWKLTQELGFRQYDCYTLKYDADEKARVLA